MPNCLGHFLDRVHGELFKMKCTAAPIFGSNIGDGEAAIPGLHLDAVIGNAETNGEPESLGQPIGRCARVGVNEHRNNDAWRNGSVESHWETLSLTAGERAGGIGV